MDHSSHNTESKSTERPSRTSCLLLLWQKKKVPECFSLGMTLLEVILSVAVSSVVLLLVGDLTLRIISMKTHIAEISALTQHAAFALERISAQIRLADGIVAPALGAEGTSLVLTQGSTTITYHLDAGVLREETLATTSALTASDAKVSAVRFQNVTRAGKPEAVRIELTLFGVGQIQGPSLEETFVTTVTVRNTP